jgi:RecG-like helicase
VKQRTALQTDFASYPERVGHQLSLLHRLTATPQRLDAVELENDVENEKLPCDKVNTLCEGELAVVAGRLRSVSYSPTENVPIVEAELFDGTAVVTLVFLGRRRIAGIEPGRRILARGRVGKHNGQLAIFNPWYELKCGG